LRNPGTLPEGRTHQIFEDDRFARSLFFPAGCDPGEDAGLGEAAQIEPKVAVLSAEPAFQAGVIHLDDRKLRREAKRRALGGDRGGRFVEFDFDVLRQALEPLELALEGQEIRRQRGFDPTRVPGFQEFARRFSGRRGIRSLKACRKRRSLGRPGEGEFKVLERVAAFRGVDLDRPRKATGRRSRLESMEHLVGDKRDMKVRRKPERRFSVHSGEGRDAPRPAVPYPYGEGLARGARPPVIGLARKILSPDGFPGGRRIGQADQELVFVVVKNDRDVGLAEARPNPVSNLLFQAEKLGQLGLVGRVQDSGILRGLLDRRSEPDPKSEDPRRDHPQ
jgi:hypothetical protein